MAVNNTHEDGEPSVSEGPAGGIYLERRWLAKKSKRCSLSGERDRGQTVRQRHTGQPKGDVQVEDYTVYVSPWRLFINAHIGVYPFVYLSYLHGTAVRTIQDVNL